MRRSEQRPLVVPVNLREIYQLPGEYSAKLMLDPEVSPRVDSVEGRVTNADGTPLQHTFKRWGTKLNVSFVIDDTTPDGVAVIDLEIKLKDEKLNKRFCFWVVK